MNQEHHDLNDVCHRLDRLIESAATISRQIGRLQDLSGKQLAEMVGQTALLKSIDDKTPPPSDEDIEADAVTVTTEQKESKS